MTWSSGTFVLDGPTFHRHQRRPAVLRSPRRCRSTVRCADQDEVDYYWDRLLDGGDESQCGWLKDRFGLSWQIVPEPPLRTASSDPDPARAAAATKAMLGMRKIVIAELEAAAPARERRIPPSATQATCTLIRRAAAAAG